MKSITYWISVSFTVTFVLSTIVTCEQKQCADNVISKTVEEQQSKSSEKTREGSVDVSSESNRGANGMVSGAKSISISKSSVDTDEEKKRRFEEEKTATGKKTTEESLKTKKTVSTNENKSVLIYYLVSYKRLPAKGVEECKKDYYKRIFPKESNKNVFYRKIFKAYEGEEPKAYTERVDYIFTCVYPEEDCRLDVEWLEQFDHYYTILYARKADETDEHYFPRVLKKQPGESCDHYKKRMTCLVAALDEEDFSHITFDDSEQGYKIGQRTKPVTSRSSPASYSTAQPTSQISKSSLKSKEVETDVDLSESLEKKKSAAGTSSEYEKNLKKTKTSVEKEEETKTYAYRVAYCKLPKKTCGELDEVYYRKFFGDVNKNTSKDALGEFYLRCLIQYKGENTTEYCQRVDFLFDKVYKDMDIRTNKFFSTLLEHYYREKYCKLAKETEKEWFARNITKKCGETPRKYKARIDCMQATIVDIHWSKVVIDENSQTGYMLVEQ